MKTISLKSNVIASYISQFYSAGVGIIILPLYIKIMGAEAYGLVGFYATLQAAFMLLDLGITPTVSRQTSRFRAQEIDAFQYRQLYRSLALMYFIIAAIGAGVIFSLSTVIANDWLNFVDLETGQVVVSIKIIAVIVALRWLCGLNKGVVSGNESLVWFAFFNIAVATMRFILVIPVLVFLDNSVVTFFVYQLCVSLIENALLYLKAHSLLPSLTDRAKQLRWSLTPLRPLVKFALSIAFTSVLWVIAVQADKTIMSTLLTLDDYGYFILAVSLAAGISMLSSPITSAILPRMAKLSISGSDNAVREIYFKATKANLFISTPIALIIAIFSEIILQQWTGNELITEKVGLTLTLYALGYCLLTFSSFPYYLQYAKGDLRLHVKGSIFYVVTLIILIASLVPSYGINGAGIAFFITNLVFFIMWIPIVHHKFYPELNFKWQVMILAVLSIQFILLYVFYLFIVRFSS